MKRTTVGPTPCPSATELRDALEQAGWRFTRQRMAVFDHLRGVESHPTAEEVYAAVRHDIPNISLATVYKALEALVDCGLASKICNSDGPSRYDYRSDAHYHLRCTKTGQVRDLPIAFDADLLDKLDPNLVKNLRQIGFEVTGYRLEVVGRFNEG
jgi:Fur family transcriptional regulator, peroxide stress response regulator